MCVVVCVSLVVAVRWRRCASFGVFGCRSCLLYVGFVCWLSLSVVRWRGCCSSLRVVCCCWSWLFVCFVDVRCVLFVIVRCCSLFGVCCCLLFVVGVHCSLFAGSPLFVFVGC